MKGLTIGICWFTGLWLGFGSATAQQPPPRFNVALGAVATLSLPPKAVGTEPVFTDHRSLGGGFSITAFYAPQPRWAILAKLERSAVTIDHGHYYSSGTITYTPLKLSTGVSFTHCQRTKCQHSLSAELAVIKVYADTFIRASPASLGAPSTSYVNGYNPGWPLFVNLGYRISWVQKGGRRHEMGAYFNYGFRRVTRLEFRRTDGVESVSYVDYRGNYLALEYRFFLRKAHHLNKAKHATNNGSR